MQKWDKNIFYFHTNLSERIIKDFCIIVSKYSATKELVVQG